MPAWVSLTFFQHSLAKSAIYIYNVSNVGNSSDNTKYSVKMPWLCMLCKMCDVRVCIGLVIFAAIAFIAIIVTILILMH